jgi:hypothetical protein
MNPKYRPLIFLGVTFVLMAPYLGFVIYYSQQFPSNHWPSWFTDTIAVWFIANFLVLMLVVRLTGKMFKNSVLDAEKARVLTEKAIRTNTRLLIFWSLLFLYGALRTVQGAIPLVRAIPAGAFLLFFIGFFGWSLWRAKRAKRPESGSPT